MIEPIIYTTIEQKNILEKEMIRYLSPQESLIHCLNVLDLNSAMKSRNNNSEIDSDEGIQWIILPLKNDQ